MTPISPVPALVASFLLAGMAPALAAAPATPDEEVIVRHCLAEGASEAECECGLDAAREILTPAEMSVVAELAPALSEESDIESAMLRAPDVMREKGLDFAQFLSVLEKIVEHAEVVETRCADAAG